MATLGFSTLDHFLLSGLRFNTALSSYSVLHNGENLSDHDPVLLTLGLNRENTNCTDKIHHEELAWYKAADAHLVDNRIILQSNLSRITIPTTALSCHIPLRDNIAHCEALNRYANDLAEVCVAATNASTPHTGRFNGYRSWLV
jgi:hypothetical protein